MSDPIPYDPGGMRRFRVDRATSGWQTNHITKEDGSVEDVRVFYSDCIAQACVFTKGFTVLRFVGKAPRR